MNEIRGPASALFSETAPPQEILLEVYKLYVEMADRISARRQAYNSLSISLNTLLGSGFGLALGAGLHHERTTFAWILITLGALGFVVNTLWYFLILSYKQLNSAKFQVIHKLEESLGVRPYTTEWKLMEEGKNPALYRPLTHLERWLPLVLMATSVAAALIGIVLLCRT